MAQASNKQPVLDLIHQATKSGDGNEAMRLSQAALNAAHALRAIEDVTSSPT